MSTPTDFLDVIVETFVATKGKSREEIRAALKLAFFPRGKKRSWEADEPAVVSDARGRLNAAIGAANRAAKGGDINRPPPKFVRVGWWDLVTVIDNIESAWGAACFAEFDVTDLEHDLDNALRRLRRRKRK